MMKKITVSFIIANVFDVVSTGLCLMVGGHESNLFVINYGWLVAAAVKILGVMIVVLFLELVETWWFFWAIPAIVWLAGVWNIANYVAMVIG